MDSAFPICQSNPIQSNPIQSNPIQSNPIQSNPIQSNSIQFNSIQFNSIQFNSIQFNSIQFNSIQFNSIQFNSIQFNSIQFNSIQFNSIQFNSRHQQVCRLCVNPTNACYKTSTSVSTVCESNNCMFHDINKCVDCVLVQQMHVPRHQQVFRLCVNPTNACSTISTSVSTVCKSNKCMFHDINKCVDCV